MSLLRDERGSWSAARVLLVCWLLNACAWLWFGEPNNVTLAFLSGVALPLICWAAGPRMAAYLAPTIGATVKSVADAKRKEPDMYRDDERGEYTERARS